MNICILLTATNGACQTKNKETGSFSKIFLRPIAIRLQSDHLVRTIDGFAFFSYLIQQLLNLETLQSQKRNYLYQSSLDIGGRDILVVLCYLMNKGMKHSEKEYSVFST